MKSGFTMDRFIVHNEVEPTEEVSKTAAGPLYKFKVPVYVDKLSDAQKAIYANNAPVVAKLLDVETVDHLVIGTPTDPAVISFIPGTNHDQLLIEFASKMPVL
jgi:hypothetical protein